MVRPTVQLDRENARLLSSAIGSLVLHALVLAPVLMALLGSSRTPRPPLQSELRPEAIEPPAPVETVPLGIDQPMPSSLTWIGYEDYREHLAQLAEVEQAAMTDDPTGMPIDQQPALALPQPAALAEGESSSTDESREAISETDKLTQAERHPDEATESSSPPPPIELIRILESLALEANGDEPDIQADRADHGSPDVEPIPDLVGRMLATMRQAATARPAQAEPKKPVRSDDAPPPASKSEPDSQQQQSPPAAPPPAPAPADQTDRDADPSSIIDVPVENWKLGRPLAAQGLELRPQRPTFTILTLLTAAPCNPLCEIVFRRDGRPISAQLVETSCDPRIDEAVLSSLYRWRAAGQPLRDLQDEQTHTVHIRILLTRRPR